MKRVDLWMIGIGLSLSVGLVAQSKDMQRKATPRSAPWLR